MINFDSYSPQSLVSVVAISYNQSRWVVDALNSVFNQDYVNIELIISDDCSNDGTIELVESWLNQHGNRFHRVCLIKSASNEGICRNVAKGIAAASGSWIKGLACDDILCEDAISQFIENTIRDKTELAFSQVAKFSNHSGKSQLLGNLITNGQRIELFNNPQSLLHSIRRENFLPAPGAFYSSRLFKSIGGIDTSFKHLDDWPLWMRMLPAVSSVSWIDKPLTLYRISEQSVSQNKLKVPIRPFLYYDHQLFYLYYQLPFYNGFESWDNRIKNFRRIIVFEHLGNSWLAYKFLRPLQLLSPLAYKLVGNWMIYQLTNLRNKVRELLKISE